MDRDIPWRKCAYFVNLSTTTSIQLALPDKGRPSTKSIEIICHAATGTGMG
jgi:hypothetical protein